MSRLVSGSIAFYWDPDRKRWDLFARSARGVGGRRAMRLSAETDVALDEVTMRHCLEALVRALEAEMPLSRHEGS